MSILASIEDKLGRFLDRQGAKVDKWMDDAQDLSEPGAPKDDGRGYKHPFHIFNEMLNGHSAKEPDQPQEAQLADLLGTLKGRPAPSKQLPEDPAILSRYEKRLAQEQAKQSAGAPEFSHASSKERAERILRAIVYASRCESTAPCNKKNSDFEASLRALDLDKEDLAIIREALDEPLEPANLASGPLSPDEALEIYAINYVLTDADNPDGRSYLERLTAVLAVPEDIRADLAERTGSAARQ